MLSTWFPVRLPLSCALVAGFAGCVREAAPPPMRVTSVEVHPSGLITYVSAHGAGSLAAAPPHLVKAVSVQGGGPQQSEWTLDGRKLDFLGEELVIGDRRYGSIRGETKIEIGPAGVLVNGEQRGELAP
ncbi:MAG: hypothetical protein IPK67_02820 [Planctomycetes bacterium]|nr:hypothetical protein [Planctomycetota bacterium]